MNILPLRRSLGRFSRAAELSRILGLNGRPMTALTTLLCYLEQGVPLVGVTAHAVDKQRDRAHVLPPWVDENSGLHYR